MKIIELLISTVIISKSLFDNITEISPAAQKHAPEINQITSNFD